MKLITLVLLLGYMELGFFKDAPLEERKQAFEIVKREFMKEKARGEEANQNVLYFLNTVATAIVGEKKEGQKETSAD